MAKGDWHGWQRGMEGNGERERRISRLARIHARVTGPRETTAIKRDVSNARIIVFSFRVNPWLLSRDTSCETRYGEGGTRGWSIRNGSREEKPTWNRVRTRGAVPLSSGAAEKKWARDLYANRRSSSAIASPTMAIRSDSPNKQRPKPLRTAIVHASTTKFDWFSARLARRPSSLWIKRRVEDVSSAVITVAWWFRYGWQGIQLLLVISVVNGCKIDGG